MYRAAWVLNTKAVLKLMRFSVIPAERGDNIKQKTPNASSGDKTRVIATHTDFITPLPR